MKKINSRFYGVAFDLDGTLYPNYRFYIRLFPFLLKEQKHLRAFGKARDRIRDEDREGITEIKPPSEAFYPDSFFRDSFYLRQAQYMAESLIKKGLPDSMDTAFLKEKTEKLIYRGWEPLFRKVKLFPHVEETLQTLRENGIKLGMLSDFPPENKIENMGLSGLWDTVLCSEVIGKLKPDPLPFNELCRAMALAPEKILYVGNSFSYDVLGAQKAGMKAAWIVPRRKYPRLNRVKINKTNNARADFVFYDYRQLLSFVIT